MYLYNVKLKLEVSEKITQTAAKYGYLDAFYSRDLFVLLFKAGSGLPSDQQISKLVSKYARKGRALGMSESRMGLVLRKRKISMSNLSTGSLFRAAVVSSMSPMERFEALLVLLRKAARKTTQIQCATCTHVRQCKFAKKYMHSAAGSIAVAIDRDYASLIHTDCPARPDLDLTNAVYAAESAFLNKTDAELDALFAKMNQFANSVTEDEDDEDGDDADKVNTDNLPVYAVGDGSLSQLSKESSITGQNKFSIMSDMVDKLKISDLILYEFARKLTGAISTSLKGKFKPKAPKPKEKIIEQMQETRDIVKAVSSEFAQGDDILDLKIAKKELSIREDVGTQDKPQLLVLLVDTSGSMMGSVFSEKLMETGVITRAQVASIFSTALISHVVSEKGEVLFSTFDATTTTPYIVKDKATEANCLNRISLTTYDGHSTNLDLALRISTDYVKAAEKKYSEAEILVITDMDTSISDTTIALISEKGAVPINCLDIKPEDRDFGNARTMLKKLAKNYTKLNYNELDPKKIVSVLK